MSEGQAGLVTDPGAEPAETIPSLNSKLKRRDLSSAAQPGARAGHWAPMARYYFHVCNGTGFIEDQQGVELADHAEAREQAYRGARDIMAGDVQRGELDLSSFIEVEDENNELLFTLTFQDAVDLTRRNESSRGTRRHRASS